MWSCGRVGATRGTSFMPRPEAASVLLGLQNQSGSCEASKQHLFLALTMYDLRNIKTTWVRIAFSQIPIYSSIRDHIPM